MVYKCLYEKKKNQKDVIKNHFFQLVYGLRGFCATFKKRTNERTQNDQMNEIIDN